MSRRKEPLPYPVADPTTASPRERFPSDWPPSQKEEPATDPEIAGIADAARQISDSLLAARRWGGEDDEDNDADDDSIDLDSPRVGRMSTADDTIVNLSAPARSHRMLSPDFGDGDGDGDDAPLLLRAEEDPYAADSGVPHARDADEDRPTLPIRASNSSAKS
jgi:hypothetical protein